MNNITGEELDELQENGVIMDLVVNTSVIMPRNEDKEIRMRYYQMSPMFDIKTLSVKYVTKRSENMMVQRPKRGESCYPFTYSTNWNYIRTDLFGFWS